MKNNNLNPWYITGLTDSEGTFSCYIQRISPLKDKMTISFEYKIAQKSHSSDILYEIQNYFSGGTVVIDNRKTDTKKYHVTNLEFILEKIIPHFEQFPCLSSKNLNFKDWKQIATIVHQKKHLSSKGVEEILIILDSLNMKRSFKDKYDYCNLHLNLSSEGIVEFDLPPSWVQGFLDGEATFYVHMTPLPFNLKSVANMDSLLKQNKEKDESSWRGLPSQSERLIQAICNPSLEVAQNSHDISLLLALKTFFKGGYIKPKYNVNIMEECLNSRSVNRFIYRSPIEKIIQFLSEYPLKTRKSLDFDDWKKIIHLKNNNAHKTINGLYSMWQIKKSMNANRTPSPWR